MNLFINYNGSSSNINSYIYWGDASASYSTKTDLATKGATGNSLVLLENNTTFSIPDVCDPNIDIPLTVMEAIYSGVTGNSLNTYFIKYEQPIYLISNRDYDFSVNIYDTGIFEPVTSISSISLVVYGTTDVSVVSDVPYKNPISVHDVVENAPFDTNKYEYEYKIEPENLLIDGETGYPVSTDSNINYIEFIYWILK